MSATDGPLDELAEYVRSSLRWALWQQGRVDEAVAAAERL